MTNLERDKVRGGPWPLLRFEATPVKLYCYRGTFSCHIFLGVPDPCMVFGLCHMGYNPAMWISYHKV